MSIDVNIGSRLDAKGFKEAETALGKLNGTAKKLAGALGVAFGARAVAMYGKNAVKAFAADEKAAKSLSLTLKNLGLQYADPQAKSFISDLEKQYGVLDDQLRPAFQKLITTTQDFATSQNLLKTALDLSAMSGLDVETVASDLSKAYTGNTKGLQKYGLGIDKATLSTMSFNDILKVISKQSAGQAEEAANGVSGALDRLNVAAANASESIGKDLVTAFTTLGGEGGLPKTLGLIESFASGIGDAVIGISRLVQAANIITSSTNPIQMFKRLAAFQKEYRAADAKEQKDAEIAARRYGGIYADIYNAQKKIVTQKKILTAAELKALQAAKLKLAIDKANLALGKAGDVFDMDKIQIAAALTNQAEQLGKATTSTQVLQIANDVARLKVKQDILDLEDAIAAGDQKAIEAATAKLNADMKILAAMTGQKATITTIESILASLKPKDLIDQKNLDEALAKIAEMLKALGGFKFPSATAPTSVAGGGGGGGNGTGGGGGGYNGSSVTNQSPNNTGYPNYGMQSTFTPSLTNTPFGPNGTFVIEDVARSSFLAGLVGGAGVAGAASGARYAAQAAAQYNITIQANTIANPDELTNLVQDAVIKINRQGGSLTQAGAL